jgi:hypothetical protein
MRKALAANFAESPVRPLVFSQELRRLSSEVDEKFSGLERKQSAVMETSKERLPVGEKEIASFLKDREAVTNDGVTTFKEVKKILEDLRSHGSIDRKGFKRMYKELDDGESVLALERGALARDRARIALAISADSLHERLGEAYMMAITHGMAVPAHATIDLGGKRETADQSNFRAKLLLTYNGPDAVGKDIQWCPVVKDYVVTPSLLMTAAHLVPYCIGEANAAYLFGVNLDQGFSSLWSEKNGLLLHTSVEKAYDKAQLVIMPRFDNNNILTVVLLDQSIADSVVYPAQRGMLRYKDLGDLEFKTDARPGRRNLYISTLFTIFRRKRHGVPGHEHDFDRLSMSNNAVWASPGKWMRRSILQCIASEIGDVFTDDMTKKIIGLDEFPHQESPQQESRRAAEIRHGLEYGAPNEEDLETLEEEEDEEDCFKKVIEVEDESNVEDVAEE